MPRKPLRVVVDGETPPKPLTLLEAVDAGDYMAELVATHRRIATAVSDAAIPGRELASLTRRQLEISKELKALRAAQNGDEVGQEAVDAGDYMAELVATHRRIATAVSDAAIPGRELASLTRRQLEISKELKALRAAQNGDEVGQAADTPDEDFAV